MATQHINKQKLIERLEREQYDESEDSEPNSYRAGWNDRSRALQHDLLHEKFDVSDERCGDYPECDGTCLGGES